MICPTALLAATLALTPASADLFHEALQLAREHFYDPNRLDRHWLDDPAPRPGESATDAINRALDMLGTSHTVHFTRDHPAYFELLDIYLSDDQRARMFPDGLVQYEGIEIATRLIDGSHFISEVRHGGPADRAGLLVGDELLSADRQPFHPVQAFRGKAGEPVSMTVRREVDGEPLHIMVTPQFIQPRDAFERAMRDSARIIDTRSRRIGYVRMWSYAGQRYHDALVELLSTGRLSDADSLILDLRGGWGGASPQHAELFVGGGPDMTIITREGDEFIVNFRWRKPLVVLIDQATRSGKEVLAHSFRAAGVPLVGTNTAGAVVGGRAFLLSDDSLLLIAVVDVRIDGERLEGVGVAPSIDVPVDLPYAAGTDPQLDRAVQLLAER